MPHAIEPGQIRANETGDRLIYVEGPAWRLDEWSCMVLWPHLPQARARVGVASASEILRDYPLVCTLEVT